MGGLFGVVGADFMFKRHLGINGEYTLHITPEPYLPSAGLKMRPSFYDLNAIWQVRSGKRLVPFAEGGVGAARVALYFNPANAVTGIPIPTTPFFSNADYFQFHFAAGAKIYIKSKFFVKPQFDLHYAVHLTDQFGRNAVFGYTVSARLALSVGAVNVRPILVQHSAAKAPSFTLRNSGNEWTFFAAVVFG